MVDVAKIAAELKACHRTALLGLPDEPQQMPLGWHVMFGYPLEKLGLVARTFWLDRTYITPLGLAVRAALTQEQQPVTQNSDGVILTQATAGNGPPPGYFCPSCNGENTKCPEGCGREGFPGWYFYQRQNSEGVPVGKVISQLQDALNLAKGSGYERSSIGNDALDALLAHIAAEPDRMWEVVERCAQLADSRRDEALGKTYKGMLHLVYQTEADCARGIAEAIRAQETHNG